MHVKRNQLILFLVLFQTNHTFSKTTSTDPRKVTFSDKNDIQTFNTERNILTQQRELGDVIDRYEEFSCEQDQDEIETKNQKHGNFLSRRQMELEHQFARRHLLDELRNSEAEYLTENQKDFASFNRKFCGIKIKFKAKNDTYHEGILLGFWNTRSGEELIYFLNQQEETVTTPLTDIKPHSLAYLGWAQ